MALRLSSDLVADVARAASPDALRSATARLRNGSVDVARESFESALRSASAAAPNTPVVNLGGLRERLAGARLGEATPKLAATSAATRGLETILTKVLVDGVTPRKSALFGKGAAGESWRMLLTDALAKGIAESGRTGLGKGLVGGSLAASLAGVHSAGKRAI